MPNKRGILIVLLAAGLLLASVSCAKALTPLQPTSLPNSTPPPQATPAQILTPPGLRNLTNAEREKAIQIALNTPEAKERTTQGITYKAELNWVGIVWQGSGSRELWGLDYDVWQKGVPSNVPSSAAIYPRVDLYFEQLLVRVAVDLAAEKAVHVDTHPLKKLPR